MHNPFDPGYATTDELRGLGFAEVGDNVMVARNCTIIGLENIYIGDNVRIDGMTTISAANGPCRIGRNIHIGGYAHLACAGGVVLDDFANLSQGVRIYSVSDDYSGGTMTNPTVPCEYKGIDVSPVRIGRHVVLGSGSIVLPGVDVGDGCAVGALSLVVKSLADWGVYAGTPVRHIKARSRSLLDMEKRYLNDFG